MKAAIYKSYGGPEVIEIAEIDKPTPKDNQVLVEVHAASVNPIDWKTRAGYLKDFVPLNLPVVIAGNFSGVIEEVGKDVSGFKKGDEVYGEALVLNGGSGSAAQFLVSNEDNTSIKPKNLSHVEAASLPLAGVAALEALTESLGLKKDQKILIQGGAGGIGSLAIQIAKEIGAYVATTVSAKDIDFVKELGADEVIDYKKEDFSKKLNDFDAVFDASGQDFSEDSLKVLKKGGAYSTMYGQPDGELAKKYEVSVVREATGANTERLDMLRGLVEKGVVKPQIDKEFPLDQTREAFSYQETGHPRGKVVIKTI